MIMLRWLATGELVPEFFAALRAEDPEKLAGVDPELGYQVMERWKIVGIFSAKTLECIGAFFFDQYDQAHVFVYPAWRRRWQMLLTVAQFLDFVFAERTAVTICFPATTTVVKKLACAMGARLVENTGEMQTYILQAEDWKNGAMRAHIEQHRATHRRLDLRMQTRSA